MKILSVDNSIASPGLIKCELNDALDIIDLKYIGFSGSPKWSKVRPDGEIKSYNNKDYKNKQFEKIMMMKENMMNWVGSDFFDYVAFEDYAFSAKGQIFGIAESTGNLKGEFFERGSKIRLYSVPSIKKFYSGKGNADKIDMEDAFVADSCSYKPDWSFLPNVYENKSGNPKDNLIDSFAILQMLICELKLRYGIIEFKDLNEKQREVFLQSNGKEPNYPARDFIGK
jgi:hypothetical protein